MEKTEIATLVPLGPEDRNLGGFGRKFNLLQRLSEVQDLLIID